MTQPAIEAEGLVKAFGSVRALDGVDFAVLPGTVFGLLGPNGAGKSTVIRVLATLVAPDAGRASVGGFDVVRHPGAVRRLIGLTGQYAAVDDLLSGHENLYMIGRLIGLAAEEARRRSAQLLESFDLTEAASKTVKTYSGGMRRRLDLAASLVGRPPFLYLDEPTTGLDPRSRLQLWGVIRALVADGTTVLLSTQYLDEADRLADHIVVLDRGRVIAAGSADELKSRTGAQVLELRLADPASGSAAARILADVAGPGARLDHEGNVLRAAAKDRSLLPEIIVRLDEAGVALDEFSLRRPSLDEVFLSLTGPAVVAGDRPEEMAEGVTS